MTINPLWRQITKLEQKIEATMSEDPRPGFIENMYGSFDREDLTKQVLALYEELVGTSPNDEYARYRRAGALARANRLREALGEYRKVFGSHRSALVMAAMMELALGDRDAAQRTLDVHNARCIAEGVPIMQATLEKITLRRD